MDEFVATTGYHRRYACWLLANWYRETVWWKKGVDKIILVKDPRLPKKRRKPRWYGQNVLEALKKVWEILNCPCGKRLAPFLKEVVPVLEGHQEITLEPEVREKLLQISAASIDRLLKEEKKRWQIKGKATTSSLLKSQIPVRTYSEWDENKSGFIEVDLVGHDGGNVDGIYIQTLTATDIATGWTETVAVKNKAQVWVFEGLQALTKRFPFPILGIDSDNGGEFINHHLLEHCQAHGITFTRSRPYRKNDTCYVEQKNYTVVRKMVGYLRYETQEELELVNYPVLPHGALEALKI